MTNEQFYGKLRRTECREILCRVKNATNSGTIQTTPGSFSAAELFNPAFSGTSTNTSTQSAEGYGDHFYSVAVPSTCSASQTFQSDGLFSGPGAPPANIGDNTTVTNNIQLWGFTSPNPITQVVDPNTQTITNITEPGHIFGGQVQISVVQNNGVYTTYTGSGMGPNALANQILGPLLFTFLGYTAAMNCEMNNPPPYPIFQSY